MSQKLIMPMILPGAVIGVLVMLGIIENLFLLGLFWVFIFILYPFIIVAELPHNRLFYSFFTVFAFGTLIVWIPVDEYQLFYQHNPDKVDWLNFTYRHPRKMMLAIGEGIVFFSSLVSLIIADVLLSGAKTSRWYP